MGAPRGLSALAERKRLLVARSDLHRRLLELEQVRLASRIGVARTFVVRHRYWLFGGAALAGWMLVRRSHRATAWLPAVFSAWRTFRP